MKIGFYQYPPLFHDPEGTRKIIEKRLDGVKADLIVLPELAVSGYLFASPEEAESCAEPIPGPSTRLFARLAEKNQTHYIYGYMERDAEGNLYNSAACVFPDGRIVNYRKAHLFNREKLIFTPGDSPFSVFEVTGVKIAILVCFDHMFPEAARTLALQGVQIICHPSNLVLEGLAQVTTRSRSIENKIFWILSNRIGSESSGAVSCTYTGGSQITSPDGTLLASASRDAEELQIIEIDPSRALDKTIAKRNSIFEDRRPDLYRIQ